MDGPHRRILRVVRRSATSVICELPVGNGTCGAGGCHGCSLLTGITGLKNTAATTSITGTADSNLLARVRNREKQPTESTVKIDLPSELFPASSPSVESVRVGDTVEIHAPGSMLLALSLVFYLVPAILMLLFAVSCSYLYPNSEALVAISAAGGLGLGLGAITFFGPALRSLVTKQLIVRSNS